MNIDEYRNAIRFDDDGCRRNKSIRRDDDLIARLYPGSDEGKSECHRPVHTSQREPAAAKSGKLFLKLFDVTLAIRIRPFTTACDCGNFLHVALIKYGPRKRGLYRFISTMDGEVTLVHVIRLRCLLVLNVIIASIGARFFFAFYLNLTWLPCISPWLLMAMKANTAMARITIIVTLNHTTGWYARDSK